MATYSHPKSSLCVREHKKFLEQSVSVFQTLVQEHGAVWWAGDFNLRHIFAAAPCSTGCLESWFQHMLRTSGAFLLPSPRSHRDGGWLDLHISSTPSAAVVCRVKEMAKKCASDHYLLWVDSWFKVQPCASYTWVQAKRTDERIPVVVWSKSEKDWSIAVQEVAPALRCVTMACKAAIGRLQQAHTAAQARCIADAAALLIDTLVCAAGHASGATRVLSCRPRTSATPHAENAAL